MLGVGDKFPQFSLLAVVSSEKNDAFKTIRDSDFASKWRVFFFWPKDFSPLCPTELVHFAKLNEQFLERGAQLFGASIDSEYVHLAWRNSNPDLKNIPFPMLSDNKRELSSALGILHPDAGVSQRATFIVDTNNTIRFVSVTDLIIGRNPEEVLRVLDALQTKAPCPCNWRRGEPTL